MRAKYTLLEPHRSAEFGAQNCKKILPNNTDQLYQFQPYIYTTCCHRMAVRSYPKLLLLYIFFFFFYIDTFCSPVKCEFDALDSALGPRPLRTLTWHVTKILQAGQLLTKFGCYSVSFQMQNIFTGMYLHVCLLLSFFLIC